MKNRLMGAAALLLMGHPAFAAGVAVCTLSADKKTVTVTASNPYSQVMACEVNCHMAIPNGLSTIVCAKPVPVGVKDFVMCTELSSRPYTRVKETEANCPDPVAPPAASKSDTKEQDDDTDADELIKKLQKQGQDFIDRQRRK